MPSQETFSETGLDAQHRNTMLAEGPGAVELNGLEPSTSGLQSPRSPS